MSYTPAPWTVFKAPYKTTAFYILSKSLPGAIAHITRSTVAPMEANARLISAAPELLECLEFIVNNHAPGLADFMFGAKGETQ